MATLEIAAAGAAAYVAQKLFGKTLEEMGSDINEHYKKRRDVILHKAANKIPDSDDGKVPNLRVARDVLWNGAVTEGEVCAEYFGGILATSRSDDGADDSAIHYVDIIKSLSSKQLHLHYCIYKGLQDLFLRHGVQLSAGSGRELSKKTLYGFAVQAEKIGLNLMLDIQVLSRCGLISDDYELQHIKMTTGEHVPYFYVKPTSFGIALFAAALNQLGDWLKYSSLDFGSFQSVDLLPITSLTFEDLYMQIGLFPPQDILDKFKAIDTRE
ncbi:hypothetical protein PAEH1_02715 [Paenalcaligenes hominis]|uniref:Uncharacterized protein n=1 Tax=Paenalcaligenes hominis TaxID=643674 RepID=A0A1U9JY78_9BURK|nr:hypothetical protein [Paenalcaligenes hominis]AQS50737.1 hypothetical protein PAEH1_02715 [Paenalcaligenes hominis]